MLVRVVGNQAFTYGYWVRRIEMPGLLRKMRKSQDCQAARQAIPSLEN
jgi:hypothetical protein